jgi:hypothetical protein
MALVRAFNNNGFTNYELLTASGNARALVYIRTQARSPVNIQNRLSYDGVQSDYYGYAVNGPGTRAASIDVWLEDSLPVSAGTYNFTNDYAPVTKFVFELTGVAGEPQIIELLNGSGTLSNPYVIEFSDSVDGSFLALGYMETSSTSAILSGGEGQTDLTESSDNIITYKVAGQENDELSIENITHLTSSVIVAVSLQPLSGPQLSINQSEITPGQSITGSFSGFAAEPGTSMRIIETTNPTGNPITFTATLTNVVQDSEDDTWSGDWSGTVPDYPTTGSAPWVRSGSVKVEFVED